MPEPVEAAGPQLGLGVGAESVKQGEQVIIVPAVSDEEAQDASPTGGRRSSPTCAWWTSPARDGGPPLGGRWTLPSAAGPHSMPRCWRGSAADGGVRA